MAVYIAGIDPGLKHIGVVVIDVNSGDPSSGKVVFSRTFEPNITAVVDGLSPFAPVLLGVEEPFAGRNIRDYGNTKEVIGLILGALICMGIVQHAEVVVRTSPAAGNAELGLGKADSKTDAAKREAARRLMNTQAITDGHQASAVAAAQVAWMKYIEEVSNAEDY